MHVGLESQSGVIGAYAWIESFVHEGLDVKAGSLVLMQGNNVHTSAADCNEKSRGAFKVRVMDGGLGSMRGRRLQP